MQSKLENLRSERCERFIQKARAGEIKNYTGIDSPYEPPETPDLVVTTDAADIESCVDALFDYVKAHFRTLEAAVSK